ncbi:MAG: DNA-directed RNA polymerase subunit beta [Chloroflexi bacterium]|nr:DNA-directed RNA polymerase subunit beta [Chloroflexota bacterium]
MAERIRFGKAPEILEIPQLIRTQKESFGDFTGENWRRAEAARQEAIRKGLPDPGNDRPFGLRELFEEISPITDFNGRTYELRFAVPDEPFSKPKYTVEECRKQDRTYVAQLKVKAHLLIKTTGDVKEQEIYFGEFPMMTPQGTFIIAGTERVVVSQLVRSEGAYFTLEQDSTSGRMLCQGKVIPSRGAWLEFETSNRDVLSVKIDRKRKIPVTTFLRAIGFGSDDEIKNLFLEHDRDLRFINATLQKDAAKDEVTGLQEVYKHMRPGESPTPEAARNLVLNTFFNERRYDLGRVGRYKLNKRLHLPETKKLRTLDDQDIVGLIRLMIRLNNGEEHPDDIDHLGNRRVRAVGELIEKQFRVGLARMERVVKDKMSTQADDKAATPSSLVNTRTVTAALREFFGGSQLSQFMDQTNPLSEISHKRRLSAMGPGGLNRDRAGFDVRDVHHSHYGRICPIETPEGPSIGLIGQLATYARINDFGFIETPYRKVHRLLPSDGPDLLNRRLREDIYDTSGALLAASGTRVDAALQGRIAALPVRDIAVAPFVSRQVDVDHDYLTADTEELFFIAQANAPLNEYDEFMEERVACRHGEEFLQQAPEFIDYMDISPRQIVSIGAGLIPFLEHDDANRALMGSNMQRQAVPLIRPSAPYVGTGMELQAARDSGHIVLAQASGVVTSVTGHSITVLEDDGQEREYRLVKFLRSNAQTCINQRPTVSKGQRITADQCIADSLSTDDGELALGDNVLVAFMFWEGGNYEDAILLSQQLVREDRFTSIHIEEYEVDARDTKLGPEEITRDIPNVNADMLQNLDERGLVFVGADVQQGDVLVGKITPKGETELSAEERLLHAIFGEHAREVKDTSLRMPHGERGKVISVDVLTRPESPDLPTGVNTLVRVLVAQKRKISEGDKMAGRHGNKGVISQILPIEDMPFLPDGTPVDIILNPLGAPARMNLGQILETHLGWAAARLKQKMMSPVFDSATEAEIKDQIRRAWLVSHGYDPRGILPDELEQRLDQNWKELIAPALALSGVSGSEQAEKFLLPRLEGDAVLHTARDLLPSFRGVDLPNALVGKAPLHDGRTGLPFDAPVVVGYIYMMKLHHLVEDKIHARSTGPYSMITQQPLGGKAQFGGQRFGEMEVWTLEAYGAANILQELLTVKSDDVTGRVKTYEAIVKGQEIMEPGVPESFKVLVRELQSLALNVDVLNDNDEVVQLIEDAADAGSSLEQISLTRWER